MPLKDDLEQRIASVLQTRVDRILLCLECVNDNKNYLAALRTCDVLGVQRVWVIHPPARAGAGGAAAAAAAAAADGGGSNGSGSTEAPIEQGRKKTRIARASSSWLDMRHFSSTADALAALREDGWTVWATDLSPGAVSLTAAGLQLPERLAIVMGSESSGISSEMRQAADRCVFLPMHGFTESLNVGVASGLVLQALIAADPSVRGQLLGPGRAQQLADKWRAAAARGAPETWPGATVTQAHMKQRKQQQQQQQQHRQVVEGDGASGEAQQGGQQQQRQQAAGTGIVESAVLRAEQQQQQQGEGQAAAAAAMHCLHHLCLQQQQGAVE